MSALVIIHGVRHVERVQGFAADFCPVCGRITPFRVVRIDAYFHVYGVPITGGSPQCFIGKCTNCCCQLEVEPTRYKAVVKAAKGMPLEELIQLTFPNIQEVCARQIALARQAATDPQKLPRFEREEMLLHRFLGIAGAVERGNTEDQGRKLALLGAIALVAFPAPVAYWLNGGPFAHTWLAWLVGFLDLGAFACLMWWAVQPHYFLRKHVIPQLVNSIAPLSPGYDEIQYSLEKLEVDGWKMGKKFSADFIWKLLETKGEETPSTEMPPVRYQKVDSPLHS